jgi:hypothetical protein
LNAGTLCKQSQDFALGIGYVALSALLIGVPRRCGFSERAETG